MPEASHRTFPETLAIAFAPGETIPLHVLSPDGTYTRYEIPVEHKEALRRDLIAAGAAPIRGKDAEAVRALVAAHSRPKEK